MAVSQNAVPVEVENKPGLVDLLVVDDDAFMRDVLEMMLVRAGYAVTLAGDGEEAWEILDQKPQQFSAVLLDRMMPRLDGMGLLARLKADNRFADLPVIFQTAIDHPEEVAEGIKAGAFYYLVKPVNEKVLFAIVQSAVSVYRMSDKLQNAANQEQSVLSRLLRRSDFQLRTLQEARTLASSLANYFPQPQRVFLGISELLINAVEHGNLAITYHEKSRLLQQGKWEDEINRRLALPEYQDKKVEVRLEHVPHEMRLLIKDEGAGFAFSNYMEMSAERAFDPNGRGIAMSRMTSFDSLQYLGRGNQLVAVVRV
jgi:DNA-binding response OmpR family regulator